jgi:SSS family solute:Na+ symporter
MGAGRLTILDAAILVAFAIYAIGSGLRARRTASTGLEEYFLAGRSLAGWKAGISMAATQFAADTPLLVTGLIATAGIFSLWRLWIYALAFLLLGFVLAPSWRRAGVLTDAELAEVRYGGTGATWLRGVKAVYFGLVFNCAVLAMVLWAAKEIAEPFLRWHAWLPEGLFASLRAFVEGVGIPFARASASDVDVWVRSADNLISIAALVGLTLAYSTTGGLRSVVRTDLVQFAVMMGATALYATYVIADAGGLGAIYDGLEAIAPVGGAGGLTRDQILAFTPVHARNAGLAVLAVFGLQWLVQMNADGTGYLAQRAMACRSDRDARNAAIVFTFAQVVLRSLLWLPIGLGLLVLFPPDAALAAGALRADREASFVRGIAELLPPGAIGLMLTAMLAALASTVDSHLNWGASYFANDLYGRFFCRAWRGREPSRRALVRVARLSNVLIVAIAVAVMTQLSSIQTAWKLNLLLGAGMGVLLVLRWLWWRVNAWGELASIAASAVLAPLLLAAFPDDREALRLLCMAGGSTLAGVAASLATAPEARERLHAFYRSARPPGFWGPIARGAGVEPGRDARRLGRGLGATAAAALCFFCLLTGFGSWLAGSPVPAAWLPSRPAWIALLIALGALLVPLWVALGKGTDGDPPKPFRGRRV